MDEYEQIKSKLSDGTTTDILVAIDDLVLLSNEEAIDILVDTAINSMSGTAKRQSREALAKNFVDEARIRLWQVLNDKTSKVGSKANAIRTLGVIKDTQSVDLLITMLDKNNHRAVISSAAESLGKIGDTKSVNAIIQSLEDAVLLGDSTLIRDFIVALGQIGDMRALEHIEKITVNDYNRVHISNAIENIKKIK